MEREEAGRAEQNMMHRPSLLRPHFKKKLKTPEPPKSKKSPDSGFPVVSRPSKPPPVNKDTGGRGRRRRRRRKK
jgi:hypothetical protein